MGAARRNTGWRRFRRDDGAALVEFALLAPVLFSLLLGMFTGGLALSRKNSMTNAVREGARLGATLPEGPSWVSSVQARVDSLAGSDLSPAQICVELAQKTPSGEDTVFASSCVGDDLTDAEPDMPDGVENDACVVKVWAFRTSELNAIVFRDDLDLKADAISSYERGGDGTCAS